MFKFIKNGWQEARGSQLLQEVESSLRSLNKLGDHSFSRASMAMVDEFYGIINRHGPLTNISPDGMKKIGVYFHKEARANYDLDIGKSYGLFFLGAFFESHALPGKDAVTVRAKMKVLLQTAIDTQNNRSINSQLAGITNDAYAHSMFEQKINICIDQIFIYALSDANLLTDVIRPHMEISSEQKNCLFTEFTSYYIGAFHFFLLSPQMFSSEMSDKLFEHFIRNILARTYTDNGEAIPAENFVSYAIDTYKRNEWMEYIKIEYLGLFNSQLYNILSKRDIDIWISQAILSTTAHTIKFALELYPTIFNS